MASRNRESGGQLLKELEGAAYRSPFSPIKRPRLQRHVSIHSRSRTIRFIIGLAVGLAFGGVLLLSFSNNSLAAWMDNIFLSLVTYGGFGLILFGYFYKKNGQRTRISDFALGMGIGMIMVWFVEAGNGSITSVPINY